MQGKKVVVAVLGALVVVLGVIFWLGVSGGGTQRNAAPDGAASLGPATIGAAATATAAQGGGSGPPSAAELGDGGPITGTIHDRRVRDELRRRILAGWESGEGEAAEAARGGKLPPMPQSPDGGIDPAYIREVVRDDLFPMAKQCYEELLARDPKASGRIEMSFKIVGDDSLGGIVEEAELLADGGTLKDEKMSTCVRESLLSLAFRPPPNDGWVTVVYPLEFSP